MPLADVPTPELHPLDTLPTDGTWVHVILPVWNLVLKGEPYVTYTILTIARCRSTLDSLGYWRQFYGSSLPDSSLKGAGWWFHTGIKQKCMPIFGTEHNG